MPAKSASSDAAALDYRIVATLSLLLSLWLIWLDPLVDRDAIVYLRSADAYLREGFGAGQQLYGRPALPLCIAGLHLLTGLPLLWAGLALNTLFYALLCVAFVAVIRVLGGDRRVQLLAAAVILSQPELNDQRSSILRDPAYWALLLLALRELLLYLRRPGPAHRWRWLGCVLAASLFRFEGLFFAALSPLALLACRGLAHRTRHCLLFLLPVAVAVALGAGLIGLYAAQRPTAIPLFPGIGQHLQHLAELPARFGEVTAATGQALLEFSAREDAPVAAVAGLAAILLLNLCRALTWPWLAVLLWDRWRHHPRDLWPDDARLLRAQLGITLAYLALFTLVNRFMLERYASQAVIFLLLYLPFALDRLWAAGRRTAPRFLAVALLLGMSLDSLHNLNYQKRFIRDAADWLAVNTPTGSTLATNNQHLGWFSHRDVDWQAATEDGFELAPLLAAPDQWRDRDSLAVLVKVREEARWQAFLADTGLQPVVVFEGGRHGRVYILRPGGAAGNSERTVREPPR